MTQQQGVIVKKPKTNVYTMMLIIAFLAMCLACLFLWLEGASYDRPPTSQLAPAPGVFAAAVQTAIV